MAASSPYIWPDTVSQSEHMDPAKKNSIKKIQGNLSRIPFYGLRVPNIKEPASRVYIYQ